MNKAIPPALSFDETLSLIKEQGGLVYVPHPFDGMRTTPTYRAMVDNLHRIDVIEIYNAKVALSSFNLSAERFAAKYNIVAGAGSDAHVPQALGTAMIRMPRFTDPRSPSWPPYGRQTSSPSARACSTCSHSSCCRPPSTGCFPRTRRTRPPAAGFPSLLANIVSASAGEAPRPTIRKPVRTRP